MMIFPLSQQQVSRAACNRALQHLLLRLPLRGVLGDRLAIGSGKQRVGQPHRAGSRSGGPGVHGCDQWGRDQHGHGDERGTQRRHASMHDG